LLPLGGGPFCAVCAEEYVQAAAKNKVASEIARRKPESLEVRFILFDASKLELGLLHNR
jgi:hypothetical protein